MSMTLSMSEKQ